MTPNDILREITKTQAANALGKFFGADGAPLDLNAQVLIKAPAAVGSRVLRLAGVGVNHAGQLVLEVAELSREIGGVR